MTGEGDETRGRVLGRPWFLIGLALAVAATIPLVLADDVRYMRLGIVAALWAALIGAFLAVRYRKQATTTEEAVAQAQEVYELELEREIAARREFELEVEAETRQRVEAESRTELDALRAEIASLRDNLQGLFGGEVLLERVALTAQATRMRALREEQRVVEPGSGKPAQITAAKKESSDRPTEFIERVREKEPVRTGGRPTAPEPRRPERSMDLPVRRVAKAEPVAPPADLERTRVQPAAKKPERPQARPVEPSRPAPSRPERARPNAATTPVKREPPREPDPVEQPTQVAKALDPDWTPRAERSATDLSAAFPTRMTRPVQPEPPRAEVARPEPARAEPSWVEPVQPEPARAEPEKQSAVVPVPEDHPVVNETLPVEVRRLAQQGRPGGRRRRAEDDEAPAGRRRRPDADEAQPGVPVPDADVAPGGPRRSVAEAETAGRRSSAGDAVSSRRPAESSGYRSADAIKGRRSAEAGRRAEPDEAPAGRRHRAEGEPPSWVSTGRRAKPEADTPRSGHRTTAAEDTGSHSAGRSVSELLAANGKTATPRRRRRAED
ncbi:DUF6779 domain-containing protein [Amycolatopsis thermophila]|uniref:DUF6779 domain-containing protein n=1 Tax=Amycolatopsis thermophila TaxID=206084 RepID=A0ABU0ETW5_9PSEU|nr:DUF6779 domain-containing protein [Amycolatopsis thermophila]MDQ0378753.1 hypothetical protein [Amycolatopsis thermophila]